MTNMICANCGNEYKNGIKYCSTCGESVKNLTEQINGGNKKNTTKKKNRFILLIVLILCFIIACGTTFGVIAILNSQNYLYKKAMKEGNGLFGRKKYEAAAEAYLIASEYAVDDNQGSEKAAEAYLKYAEKLLQDGDVELAAEQYEHALSINEQKKIRAELNEIYFEIIQSKINDQEYETALTYLKKILKKDKENEKALALKGEIEGRIHSGAKENDVAQIEPEKADTSVEVNVNDKDSSNEKGETNTQKKEKILRRVTEYEDGIVSYRTIYDENGNIEISYIYNSDGTIMFWIEYENDSDGKLQRKRTLHPNDEGMFLDEYEYDVHGNLKKITTNSCNSDRGKHVLEWEEYEYDSVTGTLKKMTQYDSGGKVELFKEFDSHENVINYTYYHYDGSISVSTYQNEYDVEGKLVSSVEYDENGHVDYWKECKYDSNGNLTSLKCANGTISYQYDPDGYLIKESGIYGEIIYEYDDADSLLQKGEGKAEIYETADALIELYNRNSDTPGRFIYDKKEITSVVTGEYLITIRYVPSIKETQYGYEATAEYSRWYGEVKLKTSGDYSDNDWKTTNSLWEELNQAKRYRFIPLSEVSDWLAAEKFCESMGGHLAVISSSNENMELYKIMEDNGYQGAYFGLSDQQAEGQWKWVMNMESPYTNWHKDEPSGGSGENYAMFYYRFSDGSWNDGNFEADINGQGMFFICEWE